MAALIRWIATTHFFSGLNTTIKELAGAPWR